MLAAFSVSSPSAMQNPRQNSGFERLAGLVAPWSICYIGAVDPAPIRLAG